jgi:glycine hydroxymethyltransferase
LGSPAVTSRGFKEKNCRQLAGLIVELIKNVDQPKVKNKIKKEVVALAKKHPIYENFRW